MKKITLSKLKTLLVVAVSFFSLASTAQDKGVLLLNEFSNGANAGKEWAELIVANNINGLQTSVDISGWLFDDNNGIFNGSTVAGAGISPGHLRFADSSIWENIEVGTYVVLFNGSDTSQFDASNPAFVNAFNDANGVYAVNNGTDSIFVFVAVGISPYIEYKGNTPIVGTNNKSGYCSQDAYSLDSNAWNAVGLRNGDDSLGDGFQVRCPGCLDNPNFTDDPGFYHGASYSSQNSHVTAGNTVGEEGPHITVDTLGGTARAFEFFQGTGSSDIGTDSNWRFIDYSTATPGFPNSTANNTFRTSVSSLTHTYPVCYEFVPEETIPGVLIVTEWSNGPSGSCEYIELLVAACGGDDEVEEVDITGWIVDDNNGVYGAGSGKGISTGHLKFANIEDLKYVPVGTVIVIYNGDANCYNFTPDENYSDLTLFLQVDGTNPTTFLVNNRSASGISVKPTSSDSTYCPAAYESSALLWSRVGFGNSNDGVQVRCPECEPTFYHGASYGSSLTGRAATANDLGGPHLASGSQGGKTFILATGGCDVGNASNWSIVNSPAAGTPPSTAGVVDTAVYNPIVVDRTCVFPCCTPAEGRTGFIGSEENTIGAKAFVVGDVYPNPANKQLYIDINSTEDFTITIIDVTGRTVYNESYTGTKGVTAVSIDLADVATGTYFFNIITNSETHTQRVMINR